VSWHENAIHVLGSPVFDGPFRALWPLAVAPAAAALISDLTARRLPAGRGSGLAAALLTAMPGLVGAGVIVQALLMLDRAWTWRGFVAFQLTPIVGAALLAYVVVRAVRRHAEVRRLFAVAGPPGRRLAAAAARLGLEARELATGERECFVAGVLRPAVFVSAGALAQLDDDELVAALSHERAHLRANDTLSLAVLSVLRDLAPWGRGVALDAFRSAREAAADRAAAAAAGPLNLASALVALARPARLEPAGALLMARHDGLRWRMQALLETEAPAVTPYHLRAQLSLGLMASAVLVAWPALQFELLRLFCPNA
jgi:Zn-dependent protease with chaperone function